MKKSMWKQINHVWKKWNENKNYMSKWMWKKIVFDKELKYEFKENGMRNNNKKGYKWKNWIV